MVRRPPLMDGGIVLPKFAKSGAPETPIRSRLALRFGDKMREMFLREGLDGGTGALEAVKAQEFVGDELIIRRGLKW